MGKLSLKGVVDLHVHTAPDIRKGRILTSNCWMQE